MDAENVNISFQSSETLINSVTYRAVFNDYVQDESCDSICGSHPCLHEGLCHPLWGQTFICVCKEIPYTGT